MATIAQQIAAAKEAGYTVFPKPTGVDKFAFKGPTMAEVSKGYDSEIEAWSAAAEHHKKNKKALVADKFVILGRHAPSRGNEPGYLRTSISEWKIAEITGETPSQLKVSGDDIRYYDRTQKKGAILKRFPTLEAAQAFKEEALLAISAESAAFDAAVAAMKAAEDTKREAQRALAAAVTTWVRTQLNGGGLNNAPGT